MYSRQEISLMRQQFWTAFGQYLAPVLSATGEKVNWVNYKTGVRHIRFTMEVENNKAVIAIELGHPGKESREAAWMKLKMLRADLESRLGESWIWEQGAGKDNRLVDCIYKELAGVNIMDKGDWPALISFFKPRILALDQFWSEHQFIFES